VFDAQKTAKALVVGNAHTSQATTSLQNKFKWSKQVFSEGSKETIGSQFACVFH